MENYNYKGEKFLNRLYKDLHSNIVIHNANKSDSKNELVRKYLDKLDKASELAKSKDRVDFLKELYYQKYVIKRENIPDSYFELQKKMALDRGFGHVEIDDRTREKLIRTVIKNQRKSLEIWLDYFNSDDQVYPEWFKYYAFQGMLKLGPYNKETGTFNKRTASTTSNFTELNREALSLVYDNLSNVLDGKQVDDKSLQVLLEGGSFTKLYAYMLKKIESTNKKINSDEGIWVKYNRGDNPLKLVKSLEGRGTGWCTAGLETARIQLEGGDFYVYYTKDSSKEYKQPRIAIRMEKNKIGEIRGIAKNQNLEPEMEEVLSKKLEEFPDKDEYLKKVNDMKMLTEIYKNHKSRNLTIEELRFLYEMDDKITGFGYQKDPRIAEILNGRNLQEDLAIVFNCKPDEVTTDREDVLAGKKIICFYGNLDLNDIVDSKDLVLPENVFGNLNLQSITCATNITFPNSIAGHLNLSRVKSLKDVVLPKFLGEELYLNNLISAINVVFPYTIYGDLNLSKLRYAKDSIFPKIVTGLVDLDSLVNADNVVLPKRVGGYISLSDLKDAKDVTFPEYLKGYLNLISLERAKNVVLPRQIDATLDLNGMRVAGNLLLPEVIKGRLLFNNLKTSDGLIFPDNFKCKQVVSNLDIENMPRQQEDTSGNIISIDVHTKIKKI